MRCSFMIKEEGLPGEKLGTGKDDIVELNDDRDCFLRVHEAKKEVNEKEHIRQFCH